MTHSDRSDNFAFASGKLKNELALVLSLWLEYGERGTSERLTPVEELGLTGDGNWLEEVIELCEGDGGKLSHRRRRRHWGNELQGDEP